MVPCFWTFGNVPHEFDGSGRERERERSHREDVKRDPVIPERKCISQAATCDNWFGQRLMLKYSKPCIFREFRNELLSQSLT